MERINRLIANQTFLWEMNRLGDLEQDRIYCRHGVEHLLAVARLAYITALEEHLPPEKEVIYAAALLHDIGRRTQYETGEDHDAAGVRIAEPILTDCGFSEEEKAQILEAIGNHRSRKAGGEEVLGRLIYTADKKSRNCFACRAQESCSWSPEKKNRTLIR